MGVPLATTAKAATACTLAQLEPQAGEFMVAQGVGGASGYSLLTRGKETLAKVFLTLPSACSVGTGYIKVTAASLSVSWIGTGGPVPNPLFTNLGSAPSIPATTIQPQSAADPIFVVPSANTAQGALDSSFDATFTATITYSRKAQGSATIETGKTKVFLQMKTFERQTNALRILVVPMGDATQLYGTQYTATDQVTVQNAMQTLARIYPVPAGTGDLAGTTGGIRYTVDTATLLDLRSVAGAYPSGAARFCGTSATFAAIKGLLAQYLLSHNTANPGATADRVVGVVGGAISSGSSSGCAEGMASVSSPESWIRLIADTGTAPSMSGALASMEVSHTFGLELNQASYHSPTIEADRTTSRAYNQAGRGFIVNDHDVMDFNTSTGPWDNTTTLLAASDFSYLLCKLKPSTASSSTACVTPGNVGTASGVSAGPKYVIAGTTDGSPANTRVVEPFYANDVAETPESTNSLFRLIQLDSNGALVPGGNFGLPLSQAESTHDGSVTATTTPSLRTFYAAAPGFSGAAGEVRVVKLTAAGADPLATGTTTLFSSLKIDPPAITSISGNGFSPTTGGSETLYRTQITPRIPPKPDVVFLADTTGSMGPALQNVRSNIANIMQNVIGAQPDAQFAAASYKDEVAFCATDPYTFRIEQSLTPTTSTLRAAIDPNPDIANSGWQTAPGQGCDQPEAQLNALYRIGVGDDGNVDLPKLIGYRSGSSPVVVWFGDAAGHDPSAGHTESDAIAQLQGRGARVIAVNMTSLENSSLDSTGQATRIATATKGVVKSSNDASQVSQAILAGLSDLPVTVTPAIDGVNCAPQLSVGITPEQLTVPSGTSANFTETISVAPGTAPGTYQCLVYFKINGRIVNLPGGGDSTSPDPRFYQQIATTVSDSPKQQVTVTATSTDTSRLLLDLVYQCNLFNYVAAVAIPPTSVDGNTATFNANADRTNACAQFGGGGVLVPYVSDGWNRVGGTVRSDTSSDIKPPTAAIYSPASNASIEWNATLPLLGSGEVSGVELPASALSWSLRAPGAVSFTSVGGGSAIDIPAPSPNGWTQGVWTAKLTVTSTGGTATATVSFGTRYQFIGFFNPIVNPPDINTGTAGKSFALKWQLTSAGTPVSDLTTIATTTFAAVAMCDPNTAIVPFAKTSGQSTARFDQANMQFVFNWQTPSTVGLYLFRLTLSDGSQHDACVNLK